MTGQLAAVIDCRGLQTPVRDQGTRPSCTGFAVAAAHEWMRPSEVRSVEDVLWAGHQIDGPSLVENTRVESALAGLTAHRHSTETSWPYGAPSFPAMRTSMASDTVNQADFVGWRRIGSVTAQALAAELATGRAVVLTLAFVPGSWTTHTIDADPARKTVGSHAVLAVGSTWFGRDLSTIIKNSWGPAWGVQGYGFVSARYIAAFTVVAHVLEAAI